MATSSVRVSEVTSTTRLSNTGPQMTNSTYRPTIAITTTATNFTACSANCLTYGCRVSGAYRCDTCDPGYFSSPNGTCIRSNELCPYGQSPGGRTFSGSDDGYWQEYLPQSFRFGNNFFDDIFVNVNGFVSLGSGYVSWTPVNFPLSTGYYYDYAYYTGYSYHYRNLNIIAAFWADIDTRGNGPGRIHYNVYSRDYFSYSPSSVLERQVFDWVADRIRNRAGDSAFWPSMVVVITWENVSPYPYYYTMPQSKTTFQMILASDYRYYNSYAIFNYGYLSNWDQWRDNGQGYQAGPSDYRNLFTSGTPLAYQLPNIVGERGSLGQWILPLTRNWQFELTSEFRCRRWHWAQSSNSWMIRDAAQFYLPRCPCTVWQALWDSRFRFDAVTGCATALFSPFYAYTQRCCYNFWSSSSGFLDTRRRFQAGSLLQYNPFLYPSLHNENDVLPKRWCCVDTNNCQLYYEFRPLDTCAGYRLPIFGFTFGDPHITTPDGKNYTFNGYGEYWLVKAENVFSLQGRTDRTLDNNGSPRNATVFTAFAARGFVSSTMDNVTTQTASDRIFIGLDDAKTGLQIIVNDMPRYDLTGWFRNSPDGSTTDEYRDIFLQKRNHTLIATFFTGITLQVRVGYRALDISVVVSRDLQGRGVFKGLLGNMDGNPDNDFLNSSGRLIPSDSSEEEIFHNFGQSWLIQTPQESLFYYNQSAGEQFSSFQHLDFVPNFGTVGANPQLANSASQYCTRDGAVDDTCYYDYIATGGNEEMARSSLESNRNFQTAAQDLQRTVVYIVIDNDTVFWTVNETRSIIISMNGSDPAVTFNLWRAFSDPETDLVSINSYMWNFTWTPRDASPVNFTFTGNDSTGSLAPPVTLTVILCGCVNNGSCQWNKFQSGYNDSDAFQIVSCDCNIQLYEGRFCENFVNACLSEPCGPRRNCSLTYPGFECLECMPGYQLADNKCWDIDECNETYPDNSCNNVTEQCVNSDGGYNCTCRNGFFRNGSICQDIDECALRLDSCTQKCNNTFGGFNCDCYPGFTLIDVYNCSGLNEPNCSCDYCSSDSPCACRRGYNQTDVKNNSCTDINECRIDENICGTNATCSNTDGSFTCDCDPGFELHDGRFCQPCGQGLWGPNCANVCQCSSENCDSAAGCKLCTNRGYKGASCNEDIDECEIETRRCSNHSICNNTFGSYTCDCNDWYQFLNGSCVLLDACVYDKTNERLVQSLKIERCQHSGRCMNGTVTAGNYSCDCQAGYTGERCETDINECASSPCLYDGVCEDEVNGYKCICAEGHYGEYCQNNVTLTVVQEEITQTIGQESTTSESVTTSAGETTGATSTVVSGVTPTQSVAGATSTITPTAPVVQVNGTITTPLTNETTTPLAVVIAVATLSIVLGVLGVAALAMGGILLFSRFCPLMGAAGGALRSASQPIAEAGRIFNRPSVFPAPQRRYWYPSYFNDIEASRMTTFPMGQQMEPIRPVYTRPPAAAAAQNGDMPVRWNVLRNFQNSRGPFNNYRKNTYFY